MKQFQMSYLQQTELMLNDEDKITVSIEFYIRDVKKFSGVCTIFWELRKRYKQATVGLCTCTENDSPVIKKIAGSRTGFLNCKNMGHTENAHCR